MISAGGSSMRIKAVIAPSYRPLESVSAGLVSVMWFGSDCSIDLSFLAVPPESGTIQVVAALGRHSS